MVDTMHHWCTGNTSDHHTRTGIHNSLLLVSRRCYNLNKEHKIDTVKKPESILFIFNEEHRVLFIESKYFTI